MKKFFLAETENRYNRHEADLDWPRFASQQKMGRRRVANKSNVLRFISYKDVEKVFTINGSRI